MNAFPRREQQREREQREGNTSEAQTRRSVECVINDLASCMR